ncbi:MAG: hypothetical protein J6Y91_02710 [Alphaproteobacteria bacterium]|nr:hypothetical protein [Alphaproteobacteria bacterium]
MRVCFLLSLIMLIASCTAVEVGKVSPERKHLYDYNNNDEYCQKNPDRCVNNIPW